MYVTRFRCGESRRRGIKPGFSDSGICMDEDLRDLLELFSEVPEVHGVLNQLSGSWGSESRMGDSKLSTFG